ncbi:MAG: OmpA family protein [Acidobacteria bacterium]|nr:OmpA family protein [Acidobacteriota bacterium]
MYIHAPGFGDPQPARTTTPLKQAPPLLTFFRIDGFAVDKAVLTPTLKQAVQHLATAVKTSWQTMQPIGVVRLVGHTDASGTEQHNVGLGNRRAEAVKQELIVQLRPLLDRVLIDIAPSPGERQPRADNRTVAGRAANRRVDVFIELATAKPGKTKRPGPFVPPDPDRDGPWDQFRFRRGMPGPQAGRTLRQVLMDACEPRFGKDACKTIVDKALAMGCKGIEMLLEKLGASVSDADKQEIRKQCVARADKP